MSGAPLRAPAPWRLRSVWRDLPNARWAATESPAWVQTWSTTLLVLTLFHVLFNGTAENPTIPVQTNQVDPLNRWIWLGLLALSLPVLRVRWRAVLALARGNWPLLALLAYFAASVLWALDPGAAFRRVLLTLVQVLIFATLISGIRRAPIVHVTLTAMLAVLALADLLYWIVAPSLAVAPDGFQGLQEQKNTTGLLLILGILSGVPCLWLLTRGLWRGLWRGLLLGALALMAALLVATRSTTSQAVVLGSIVVAPLLLAVLRLPRRMVIALAAAALCLPASLLFLYLAWCGLNSVDPMLPLRGVTFSQRTDIWSFLLDEIGKRPWFGAGYESLWGIDPNIQPSLKTDQWFGTYVLISEGHDGYLDLLATGGFVGFALALAVLGRALRLAGAAVGRSVPAALAWRGSGLARPTAVFYLAFLLALLVHNVTESNLFSNNGPLAVALLICLLDLEKWRIGTASGGSRHW